MERDMNYDLELARYIWSILKSDLPVLMSWGVEIETVKVIKCGIEFKVNGFKHTGKVQIVLNGKRLLNYILCIRFFIEVHSIVSASRFFHMPTYLRVVIECQSRFFPFFPAFSRNCPDYFLHTSGSSSFRSLSDLGAR